MSFFYRSFCYPLSFFLPVLWSIESHISPPSPSYHIISSWQIVGISVYCLNEKYIAITNISVSISENNNRWIFQLATVLHTTSAKPIRGARYTRVPIALQYTFLPGSSALPSQIQARVYIYIGIFRSFYLLFKMSVYYRRLAPLCVYSPIFVKI